MKTLSRKNLKKKLAKLKSKKIVKWIQTKSKRTIGIISSGWNNTKRVLMYPLSLVCKLGRKLRAYYSNGKSRIKVLSQQIWFQEIAKDIKVILYYGVLSSLAVFSIMAFPAFTIITIPGYGSAIYMLMDFIKYLSDIKRDRIR